MAMHTDSETPFLFLAGYLIAFSIENPNLDQFCKSTPAIIYTLLKKQKNYKFNGLLFLHVAA